MHVERRFLHALGTATKVSFVAGRLVLTSLDQGAASSMLFERAPAR